MEFSVLNITSSSHLSVLNEGVQAPQVKTQVPTDVFLVVTHSTLRHQAPEFFFRSTELLFPVLQGPIPVHELKPRCFHEAHSIFVKLPAPPHSHLQP